MSSLPNTHVVSYREIAIELVATPLRAIGNWLINAAENNPRYLAVQRISEMTDQELAAKGLTRADAVRQALGAYF